MVKTIYDLDGISGVVRDDGVFHVIGKGTLTLAHVEQLGPISLSYCQQHAPVRYLVEPREMDIDNLAARWKMAELMKQQRPYVARTAVVGLTPAMKLVAKMVIKVSRRDNVKVFDRLEDAEAYLAEGG